MMIEASMMRAVEMMSAATLTPVVRVCVPVVAISIAVTMMVAEAMMMTSALTHIHVMPTSAGSLMSRGYACPEPDEERHSEDR